MTEVFSAISPNLSPSPPTEDIDANGDMSTAPESVQEKDEVFWTELEIRRLGNLVAECIHSRRYVGDGAAADTERKQLRTYIEAMKRKSMRVLHRAELYTQSGYAAWPGIDPTISDPVSLAEEYVRVVENYDAVLCEEESRAREARSAAALGTDVDDVMKNINGEEEDWEAADSAAYIEALERERDGSREAEQKRKELISDGGGVRRRKREAASSEAEPTAYSKEEEQLMARHRPIQDELTSNLVNLVGQLKDSITVNSDKLSRDSKVLDETEDAVDKNVTGVDKQRTELKKYTQSTTVSWWIMMVAAIIVLVIFVLVLILLKVPL